MYITIKLITPPATTSQIISTTSPLYNSFPTPPDSEKYTDALTRNFMAAMIILEPDSPQVMLMLGIGGPGNAAAAGTGQAFDFGERIREAARGLKG
jgi:hypothetical protein